MLLEEALQQVAEVGFAYLFEVVEDPGIGLVDVDDPVQIDGRTNDHRIAIGGVDRRFEICSCSSPYPMAGRIVTDVGIDLEGLLQRPTR